MDSTWIWASYAEKSDSMSGMFFSMRQYMLQTSLCCGAGGVVIDHHAGSNFRVDPLLLGQHLLQGLKVFAEWLLQLLLYSFELGLVKALLPHAGQNLSGFKEVATSLISYQ